VLSLKTQRRKLQAQQKQARRNHVSSLPRLCALLGPGG
jgi:hypothetical protein